MRPALAAAALLAFVALSGTTLVQAALADGPVDIRGTWSGSYVTSIGTFQDSFTFVDEDFTTGAVSGNGNNDTYTVTGTVSGSTVTFTATTSGYSATATATVSADGQTMTGSGTDTNGRSGTFTLARFTGLLPSSGPGPTAAPAPGCTFGGAGGNTSPLPTPSLDPAVVKLVPDIVNGKALSPGPIAIDTGDPRGLVYVASLLSPTIAVIGGRPLAAGDIAIESSVDVGALNTALAVDPASGNVFVAVENRCQIVVVAGRAGRLGADTTLNLPGNPNDVAFDPASGRLFVALSALNSVLAFGPGLTAPPVEIPVPGGPNRFAVDASRGFVYVTTTTVTTPGATVTGSVVTIDDRGSAPTKTSEIPASTPSSIAVDPTGHTVYAAELGTGVLTAFTADANGALVRGQSTSIDADPTARSISAMVVLPGRRELFAPLATAAHANLYAIAPDGSLTLERAVLGVAGGIGVALDPSTGRVFVSEFRQGAVAVVALDAAVQAPPSLAAALPGPLEISLAPQDVARSVGITTFLMLLLGAPTPLFNSTLAAKRDLIGRWLRRKLPRRLRSRTTVGTTGRWLAALARTWPGLIAYLVVVTLLYAFLDPTFPAANAGLVVGMTLFGIAAGSALSQVPAELYVRRRYGAGGRIRVAFWTLGVAATCVVLTRVSGVQPGYVYGIIGGFVFGVTLTAADHGRMAFRGMAILLGVSFAAWFLRVPFQPSVGIVAGDAGTIGNSLLADLFVSGVQGAVIGLIPLRFLTGSALFAWSRARWAVLWGLALLLFAHVILYPVSTFEPKPSPAGLWTVALVVAAYATIAVGFWGFFERRDRRRQRRLAALAAG